MRHSNRVGHRRRDRGGRRLRAQGVRNYQPPVAVSVCGFGGVLTRDTGTTASFCWTLTAVALASAAPAKGIAPSVEAEATRSSDPSGAITETPKR